VSPAARVRAGHFFIAALVVLLDRLTKILAARNIELNVGSITIIQNCFSLTHVENPGAAFSLMANAPPALRLGVLVAFSSVAMLVVAWLLWRHGTRMHWTTAALALVLGGACGNLWDRLLRHRVTDFLHVYWRNYSWPDFNLADSSIVVGATVLIAGIVFGAKRGGQQ